MQFYLDVHQLKVVATKDIFTAVTNHTRILARSGEKSISFIKHYFPESFFLVFENHEMQPTILPQRVATLMEVLFFLPQKMGLHFSHHLQQASTHKFSASYSLFPLLFSTKKSKTNFITYPICYPVKNHGWKLETSLVEIHTFGWIICLENDVKMISEWCKDVKMT